jgi:replicative DNA helicase
MADYSKVPAELKQLKRWTCFCLYWNPKKNDGKGGYSKPPICPTSLWNGSSTNAEKWSDFKTAAAQIGKPCHYKAGEQTVESKVEGVGFVFEGSGYFGIDLDHVLTGDKLTEAASDIIRTADSYAEISPSGTGVHILCKGAIPAGRNKVANGDGTDFEMYESGRYFTVTGNALGEVKPVQERTAQAAAIHKKYFPQPEQPRQQATAYTMPDTGGRLEDGLRNDRGLIDLWQGNRSSSDESANDLALMNKLAYWLDGNTGKMIEAFKASPFAQQKQGEHFKKVYVRTDYVERTAAKAASECSRTASQDYMEYTQKKTASSAATPETVVGNIGEQANTTVEPLYHEKELVSSDNPRPDAVSDYLEKNFTKDIERFVGYKDRKTGFDNLDRLCGGLYPGLYVVGAISSLGKTTFVHQMGDQLAAAGDHVLFFSLEQNRLEMVTKSLSRITGRHNKATAKSAIEIRSGKITQEVINAAEEYSKIGDRVSVVECNFNTSIDFITGYTLQYIKANGVKPIVIVDYLQIIPPADPRQSDKEKVDSIVRGLKKLQSENDLVLFVVSSINRANYLSPVDFESFKESGSIEYTADVVWGLQLQVLNDDIFNRDTKIKEKREKVREAKKAIPRKIELLCLKNRYGVSSYSCGFIYDPRYDLFEPDRMYGIEDDTPRRTGRR